MSDLITVTKTKPADIDEKLFYATYGAYPQTYVGDALNNELKAASSSDLVPTGKTYTVDMGSSTVDGYTGSFYGSGRKGVHTATLVEYTYNGMTVAKLDSAMTYTQPFGIKQGCSFNNYSVVVDGETYFFFVEPILTRAMQKNENGTYTVQTCQVIGSMAFNLKGTEGYDNSWENSRIRDYLNSTFLAESGLTDIVVETTIKNNNLWNTSPCDEDTTDKIWLASCEEILAWNGVSDRVDELVKGEIIYIKNALERNHEISDMAVATFCLKQSSDDYGNVTRIWLRTSGLDTSTVCIMDNYEVAIDAGEGEDPITYYWADIGFCPCFAVNL